MAAKTIELHRLSDGGLVYIERIGRTYLYGRTYPGLFEAPDGAHGLSKAQAYAMLRNALEADTMEREN